MESLWVVVVLISFALILAGAGLALLVVKGFGNKNVTVSLVQDEEEEERKAKMAPLLAEVLKCSICWDSPMKIPIYQCRHGHLLCWECESRLSTCPTCNEVLLKRSKTRNRAIEQIQPAVIGWCKNNSKGCEVGFYDVTELEEHNRKCKGGRARRRNTGMGHRRNPHHSTMLNIPPHHQISNLEVSAIVEDGLMVIAPVVHSPPRDIDRLDFDSIRYELENIEPSSISSSISTTSSSSSSSSGFEANISVIEERSH